MRSLYQCGNARVKGKEIYCKELFKLSPAGSIPIIRLEEGEDPLIVDICQKCAQFDSMGEQIKLSERGWIK